MKVEDNREGHICAQRRREHPEQTVRGAIGRVDLEALAVEESDTSGTPRNLPLHVSVSFEL